MLFMSSVLLFSDLEIENVRKQFEKKLQIERSTIAGLKVMISDCTSSLLFLTRLFEVIGR